VRIQADFSPGRMQNFLKQGFASYFTLDTFAVLIFEGFKKKI